MKSYGMTDIGCVRAENQDYIYYTDEPIGMLDNLYIVADGMGGHNAGSYASKFTTDRLVENARKSEGWDIVSFLKNVLKQINDEILEIGRRDLQYTGMGTTVVACSVKERKAYIVNVGDSRCYRIKNDEMEQISVDHSYVQELVDAGVITKEEAREHPKKNIITRAVGAPKELEADHFIVDLDENEYLLLCSDGLHGMVEEEKIKEVVTSDRSLEEKTKELIEEAKSNGGRDNISLVLLTLGNRGDEAC